MVQREGLVDKLSVTADGSGSRGGRRRMRRCASRGRGTSPGATSSVI